MSKIGQSQNKQPATAPGEASPGADGTLPAQHIADFRRYVISTDIALAREILVLSIPKATDIARPLLNIAAQLRLELGEDALPRQWFENLLSCHEALLDNVGQDVSIAHQGQLDSLHAELQLIASESHQLVTELKSALTNVLEAHETRVQNILQNSAREERDGVEYREYLPDSLSEDHDDEDEAPSFHDFIGAQFKEWLSDLDEIRNKIDLARPRPDVRTVADLLSRWSTPRVATAECEESELVGAAAHESISAIQLVLSRMRDAWGDIRSLPRMTAEQAAYAFGSDRSSDPSVQDHWSHIENVLAPQMPIVVSAAPGRLVRLVMYAPDTTLTFCTQAWAELNKQLESLKPLLHHLGADLSIDSQCIRDNVVFSCNLTLPGNSLQLAPVDATTARLMERDGRTARGESPHQVDQVMPMVITDDFGDTEVKILTLASGLLHPTNRERLGVFLPQLARVASELGVRHVIAIPEADSSMEEMSEFRGEVHQDAYESGDYMISMLSDNNPMPRNRNDVALDELRESRAYLRRWAAVGDDAERISSTPEKLKTRIALPLSFLAQPEGVEQLEQLAQLTSIEGLDFCSFALSPEQCSVALEQATTFLDDLQSYLNIDEETRLVCLSLRPPSQSDSHVRMVLSDSRHALWATMDFNPGEPGCVLKRFPHRELGDLNVALHDIVADLMGEDRAAVHVSELRAALLPEGFDICDELLLAVCKAQYECEEPLSAEAYGHSVLRFLTFSPAAFEVEVEAIPDGEIRLRIIDRTYKVFRGLQ